MIDSNNMKVNIKPENVAEIMNFAYGKPSKIIASKFFALMKLFETKGMAVDTEGYEKFKVIELNNGLMVGVEKHTVCGMFRVRTLVLK